MSLQSELNLIGVFCSICLIKCKNALCTMQPGETLDVLIADPEVVDELEKIIRRSDDQVLRRFKERDHYRIRIRKGKKTGSEQSGK